MGNPRRRCRHSLGRGRRRRPRHSAWARPRSSPSAPTPPRLRSRKPALPDHTHPAYRWENNPDSLPHRRSNLRRCDHLGHRRFLCRTRRSSPPTGKQ
jgi:hypothetical protein